MDLHLLSGGGAEQDPDDWWRAILAASHRLRERHPHEYGQVTAICMSSQWGGLVPVDADGRHVHPALTWMDSRGSRYSQDLTGGGLRVPGGYNARALRHWLSRTGGVPTRTGKDPVGQAAWLRHERPEVDAAAAYLLDVPEYLTMRLTGRAVAGWNTSVLRWCTDNRDPSDVRWDPALAAALRPGPGPAARAGSPRQRGRHGPADRRRRVRPARRGARGRRHRRHDRGGRSRRAAHGRRGGVARAGDHAHPVGQAELGGDGRPRPCRPRWRGEPARAAGPVQAAALRPRKVRERQGGRNWCTSAAPRCPPDVRAAGEPHGEPQGDIEQVGRGGIHLRSRGLPSRGRTPTGRQLPPWGRPRVEAPARCTPRAPSHAREVLGVPAAPRVHPVRAGCACRPPRLRHRPAPLAAHADGGHLPVSCGCRSRRRWLAARIARHQSSGSCSAPPPDGRWRSSVSFSWPTSPRRCSRGRPGAPRFRGPPRGRSRSPGRVP